MDQQEIRSILEQASSGVCTVDEAVLALKMEPFQDLGFAKIDRHRCLRQGGQRGEYWQRLWRGLSGQHDQPAVASVYR